MRTSRFLLLKSKEEKQKETHCRYLFTRKENAIKYKQKKILQKQLPRTTGTRTTYSNSTLADEASHTHTHKNPERKEKERRTSLVAGPGRPARSGLIVVRMAPDLATAHPRSSDQLPPTLLEQPRTLRRATPRRTNSNSTNEKLY